MLIDIRLAIINSLQLEENLLSLAVFLPALSRAEPVILALCKEGSLAASAHTERVGICYLQRKQNLSR